MRAILVPLFVLAAAPAVAEAPRLGLPIDCRLGESCWVMNYPDTDPGPGARDHVCRPRTYDGHAGTDFAVRDLAAMRRGVAVLAAAPGTVVAVRDGVEDGAWIAGRKKEIVQARRQCGNRVAIDHGDGWVTDYCHMRKGSIRVRMGEQVRAGQPIGLVGTSGMTDFPHAHMGVLHFAPGSKDGDPMDPFTGGDLKAGCGRAGAPLWAVPLGYQAGAFYGAGFADHIPKGGEVKERASGVERLPPNAPALVVWGTLFGAAKGDRLRVRMTGPDGSLLLDKTVVVDGNQAWRLSAMGKNRPQGGWKPGRYAATMSWQRAGRPTVSRAVMVEVRP